MQFVFSAQSSSLNNKGIPGKPYPIFLLFLSHENDLIFQFVKTKIRTKSTCFEKLKEKLCSHSHPKLIKIYQ